MLVVPSSCAHCSVEATYIGQPWSKPFISYTFKKERSRPLSWEHE